MAHVTGIYRHPLKSHGREALQHVSLSKGETMPWDRCWAVAHEASTANGSTWVPCVNFSRGSKAPSLMAIEAKLDEAAQTLTLSHPNRKDFTFPTGRPPPTLRVFSLGETTYAERSRPIGTHYPHTKAWLHGYGLPLDQH